MVLDFKNTSLRKFTFVCMTEYASGYEYFCKIYLICTHFSKACKRIGAN